MKGFTFIILLLSMLWIKIRTKVLCSAKDMYEACEKDEDCDSNYCNYRDDVANDKQKRCLPTRVTGQRCRCDGECENGSCSGNLFGLKQGACN